MWESAEVAVSLMRQMMVELELKRQAAHKRVQEAGAPIPADVGDAGEEEEAEAAFAPDEDQLCQGLDAAPPYARGDDEELAGVLLAFAENRVEVAGQHLQKLQPGTAFAGLMSERPVVATTQASPRRLRS
jgi:hypothetical protein